MFNHFVPNDRLRDFIRVPRLKKWVNNYLCYFSHLFLKVGVTYIFTYASFQPLNGQKRDNISELSQFLSVIRSNYNCDVYDFSNFEFSGSRQTFYTHFLYIMKKQNVTRKIYF